jgi:hypothetical protein
LGKDLQGQEPHCKRDRVSNVISLCGDGYSRNAYALPLLPVKPRNP